MKVAEGWKYRVIVIDKEGGKAYDDVSSTEQAGYAAENLAEEIEGRRSDKEYKEKEGMIDKVHEQGKEGTTKEPDIPF